ATGPASGPGAGASDRAAPWEHRHEAPEARRARARWGRSRCLRPRPPRALGQDRPPVRAGGGAAGGRPGRPRAPDSSGRGGGRGACRPCGDPPPGRGGAGLCRRHRRRVPRARGGPPGWRDAHRAGGRRGRQLARATFGHRSGGARRRARRARPLRILLARPEGRNEKLAGRPRAHDVVGEPLIAVEPLGDDPIELGSYDWVIVTSVTGARELRRRGRGQPDRTAAIGHATADALGGADLVPEVSTQEGLLEAFPRPAGRVLFAGAEGARRLLVDELGADFQPLYGTRELVPATLPQADLAVVASASAARALGALKIDIPIVSNGPETAEADRAARALGPPQHDTPIASIGPETTKAAEAAGVRVVEEATTHDLSGLVDAV